jgi:hypothetical protein
VLGEDAVSCPGKGLEKWISMEHGAWSMEHEVGAFDGAFPEWTSIRSLIWCGVYR